jgi:prepilin-type N-terminal cleavage/methylation domain-containing protein/prepilin-type processing-associated H-X9-DG protein
MEKRTNNRTSATTAVRGAFTMIELIVVLAVIALLAALLLPAVQQSRESARRIQCVNNLRQLGLALHAHGTQFGRLPALGYMGLDSSGSVAPYFGWTVVILPHLEQGNRYQKWNLSKPLSDPNNQTIALTTLPVFVCPSDTSTTGKGDLSYVANAGLGWTIAFNGANDCPIGFPLLNPLDRCPTSSGTDGFPSDQDLLAMTGVFFLESTGVPGVSRHHTLDTITDGLSNTVLLSENIRAGADPLNPLSSWATPDPLRTGFFLTSDICRGGSCSAANTSEAVANGLSGGINTGLARAEGEAPWPSSKHQGGVNVCLADGSVRFLSERVASIVYYAMVTSRGSDIRGALADDPGAQGDH